MVDKVKILAGRKAVDAYGEAHRQLHSEPWRRGIPKDHTPLLNTMLNTLRSLGFSSLDDFHRASEWLNVVETGILDNVIRQDRQDLLLIGDTLNLGVLYDKEGTRIEVVENYVRGKEITLYINADHVMTTSPVDLISMKRDVDFCPDNSQVFVAGLGLGLVLLCLAQTKKASQVLVCEINETLISLLARRFKNKMGELYPDFDFSIIQGDAFVEVSQHGKFDWIYFDTGKLSSESTFEAIARNYLTANGIYTHWKPYSVEGW